WRTCTVRSALSAFNATNSPTRCRSNRTPSAVVRCGSPPLPGEGGKSGDDEFGGWSQVLGVSHTLPGLSCRSAGPLSGLLGSGSHRPASAPSQLELGSSSSDGVPPLSGVSGHPNQHQWSVPVTTPLAPAPIVPSTW